MKLYAVRYCLHGHAYGLFWSSSVSALFDEIDELTNPCDMEYREIRSSGSIRWGGKSDAKFDDPVTVSGKPLPPDPSDWSDEQAQRRYAAEGRQAAKAAKHLFFEGSLDALVAPPVDAEAEVWVRFKPEDGY